MIAKSWVEMIGHDKVVSINHGYGNKSNSFGMVVLSVIVLAVIATFRSPCTTAQASGVLVFGV